MRLDSDSRAKLRFKIGGEPTILAMPGLPPLPPFAAEVVDFFGDLSRILVAKGRDYPDVATFGFWCRKASLQREKASFADAGRRLGRGIVFHSTPSNVPVNFAYSFASGLLAGNANVVRLPAKGFPQVDIICDSIRHLIESEHRSLKPYVCMLSFPTHKPVIDWLSSICASRVLWGGDETIANLRRSPLPARASEITFADRFSIAVVDSDSFLAQKAKAKVVQGFYNDTFLSDQNACTSPRILIWLGGKKAEAKEVFWAHVHDLAKAKYKLLPAHSVGKLAALCVAATQIGVTKVPAQDQYVYRLTVDRLSPELLNFKYHSGFFFEFDAQTLQDILPVCIGKCQTISYYGIDRADWESFMARNRPPGVDRIVPIGRSMDFDLVWDGHDLIRSLSRVVDIRT